MSLALPFKFIARLEEAGLECPDVLSVGQIIRVMSIFGLLGVALASLEMSGFSGSM